MKQLLMPVVIALILSGCQKQSEPAVDVQADVSETVESAAASEDLSTPVDTVATDADLGYTDEGQPNADQPLLVNHFKVERQAQFDGSDSVAIQKITDGPLTVNAIQVNRGKCALLTNPDPKTLDYSGTMMVHLWGCGAADVLEVRVETDQGYAVYGF